MLSTEFLVCFLNEYTRLSFCHKRTQALQTMAVNAASNVGNASAGIAAAAVSTTASAAAGISAAAFATVAFVSPITWNLGSYLSSSSSVIDAIALDLTGSCSCWKFYSFLV
jgi:hypothetical protein